MLIWQEGTIFSVKLEIKTAVFSKCLCYPSVQKKTSDHSFGGCYLVTEETTSRFFRTLTVFNQLDFGLSHCNESRPLPPWMDFYPNFSYSSLTQYKEVKVHRSAQCYLCQWTLWEQFQKTSGLCVWRLKGLLSQQRETCSWNKHSIQYNKLAFTGFFLPGEKFGA